MSSSSIEQLADPNFVTDLAALPLTEIRSRRTRCQDAEELLSLERRLVQGRLDIIQAELYRRAGGGSESDVASLVESLPDILVERGDRHLGPGRLTSLEAENPELGADFEAFSDSLDNVIDGGRLSKLGKEDEAALRSIADQLDEIEREVSGNRHKLHGHIDRLQEEVVRRYKSGDANVDSLLGG
jgi:hypothetical protein